MIRKMDLAFNNSQTALYTMEIIRTTSHKVEENSPTKMDKSTKASGGMEQSKARESFTA